MSENRSRRSDGRRSSQQPSKYAEREEHLGRLQRGAPFRLGFHYPRHPSNTQAFSDYLIARSLFEEIMSGSADTEIEFPILDAYYDDDNQRYAMYDNFLDIVVYDADYFGARYILDDMMHDALPKRNPRCLFGGRCPSEEIDRWPAFGHDKFNEFLARSEFDHRGILDMLFDAKLANLAIWLMGCADAHFIRRSKD